MAESSNSARPTKANPNALRFYPKDEKLIGVEFPAHCMPDVSVRTRVIAVCGITDIKGLASPSKDGWFLSDFYLFNHLLRKAQVANQTWFTSCDPKYLVKQYTRYTHGNSFHERRVVLEERLLEEIYAPGSLNVVAPNILLDRFLTAVRDECTAALHNNQDVLLLVFGHGDKGTYGVTIGSNSAKQFHERTAPRLRMDRLKLAVGQKVQCTLLMTSCYSGGWAMRPDLNLTIVAAAGPKKESSSWNKTSSFRFPGSIVASAICKVIFATEVIETEKMGTDDEEPQDTETFAEMACLIYDHLKETDRFHDSHEISFSVQDDLWTKAWRERTGIPIAFFKQRWEQLTIVPAKPDSYTNRDPASTLDVPQGLSSLSLSGSRIGSTRPLRPTMRLPQMYNLTRAWAAGYMNSFPGADNLSSNTAFHSCLEDLLSGKDQYKDQMDDLLDLGTALIYRLDSIAQATHYKDLLGLNYLDCNACEIEGWTYPLYASNQQDAKEKLRRFDITLELIDDAKLFSGPVGAQGWHYSKPEHYLAIALVESRMSKGDVTEAINILKAGKSFISALCSLP